MTKLIAAMPRHKEFRFHDLVDLCREQGLFIRLVGTNNDDDEDFDRGKKNILARIFTRFDDRLFAGGVVFRIQRPSKHVSVFYVEPDKAGYSGDSGHF